VVVAVIYAPREREKREDEVERGSEHHPERERSEPCSCDLAEHAPRNAAPGRADADDRAARNITETNTTSPCAVPPRSTVPGFFSALMADNMDRLTLASR
jgi:hypothetical protein